MSKSPLDLVMDRSALLTEGPQSVDLKWSEQMVRTFSVKHQIAVPSQPGRSHVLCHPSKPHRPQQSLGAYSMTLVFVHRQMISRPRISLSREDSRFLLELWSSAACKHMVNSHCCHWPKFTLTGALNWPRCADYTSLWSTSYIRGGLLTRQPDWSMITWAGR